MCWVDVLPVIAEDIAHCSCNAGRNFQKWQSVACESSNTALCCPFEALQLHCGLPAVAGAWLGVQTYISTCLEHSCAGTAYHNVMLKAAVAACATAVPASVHVDWPCGQVMLRVGDLQKSIDYYQNVLGMKLLRTRYYMCCCHCHCHSHGCSCCCGSHEQQTSWYQLMVSATGLQHATVSVKLLLVLLSCSATHGQFT